ncbi:hypothetical protein Tco_0345793 [Tanacetum coccineum]
MEQELRLKREAAERAFEAQAEKDRTLMRLGTAKRIESLKSEAGLINSQEYYPTQDYSMGQGSAHDTAHGSAPVDDDDDSPVEEMSPVKAKKPSKRALRAKKNDIKKKEAPKEWTKAKEIALCQAWCDVSENSEKGNSMKAKGFNERVQLDP